MQNKNSKARLCDVTEADLSCLCGGTADAPDLKSGGQ